MRPLAAGILICLAGCVPATGPDVVVVYSALDAEFAEPVLDEFARTAHVRVLPKFDIESTKTVGLTQAIIAEGERPRCDVFWNNEILNTLRLEERGLLEVYRSPAGQSFPERYRSPQGTWHGFAGRARVLLVHTGLVGEAERPTSVYDLANPRWRGKVGLAKPLFGTTATHIACLFAHLGSEPARDMLRSMKRNEVQVLSGNKQVAQAVARGQLAFGLTDTDDAIIELEQGEPVVIVYPDRNPDQMGTLFIPNTLAILKNCPHPESARKLVDYLLDPAVEVRLARSASAQIPLNPRVEVALRVETPRTVKALAVDFSAAARQWDSAAQFVRDEFLDD